MTKSSYHHPARRALLISAAALFAASPLIAVDYTWNATTGNWDVSGNWSPNTGTPGSADSVTFTTGTSASTNGNRQITNLTANNDAAFSLLFTAGNSLTLSGNLTKTGTGAFTFGVDGTNSTIALSNASRWDITGGNIEMRGGNLLTGSGALTKAGTGALSLRNNSSNFAGGMILEAGTIIARSTGTNTNLGNASTSKLTFQNVTASTTNILTYDGNGSATIANAFVNNNSAASTTARINMGTGGGNPRVLTLTGSFSTGANVASSAVLDFSATGGSTAATNTEHRIDLSGDWSGYTGTTGGIGLRGPSTSDRGTLQINAQQSIAPTNQAYFIDIADSNTLAGDGVTPLSGKLILNGAFTMGNSVTFRNDAGAGHANSFGSRNDTGTTATLSGTLTQNDAKAAIGSRSLGGANVFSQTAGATLNLAGDIAGAQLLTINSTYSYQTGSGVALQTPTGTVEISKADGVSFTGALRAVNGTLLVTNTSGSATGTGNVTIDDAATLAGTGIINASAAARTVTINGTVSPGRVGEVGTLSLGATGGVTFGSTADIALQVANDGVSFDRLNFNSTTTLDGSLSFSFGSMLTASSYDFFGGSISSVSASLLDSVTATGAYGNITFTNDVGTSTWRHLGTGLSFDASTGVLTAIPEPSSFAAIAGLGMLGFAGLRRRRAAR